jgi:hypothetical protein
MDLLLFLSKNEGLSKSDVDSIKISDKLVAISELLKSNNTLMNVLQFIINNDNFLPNVVVALRIILTMNVSMYRLHQANGAFPSKNNQYIFEFKIFRHLFFN